MRSLVTTSCAAGRGRRMPTKITVGEMQAYLAECVPRRAMGLNRTRQPSNDGG